MPLCPPPLTPTRVSRVLLDLQLVHGKCPTNLKHNILEEKNIFFFSWQGEGGSEHLQKGSRGLPTTAGCSRFPSSHLPSRLGGTGRERLPCLRWNPRFQSKDRREKGTWVTCVGSVPNPRNRRHGIRGRSRPWNKTKFRSMERASVLAATEQGTAGKDVGAHGAKKMWGAH